MAPGARRRALRTRTCDQGEHVILEHVLSFARQQSCRLLPNFGRPPEFGRFQEIAQKIAQNFCAIFKIGQKHPKKLPNGTKT